MQCTPQYYYPFMFGPPPFVPIHGMYISIQLLLKIFYIRYKIIVKLFLQKQNIVISQMDVMAEVVAMEHRTINIIGSKKERRTCTNIVIRLELV